MSDSDTCCFTARESERSQEAVWRRCAEEIQTAVEDQLTGESGPVLVDAIPTTGKTHAAARVTSAIDEPILIVSHLHETRDTLVREIDSDTLVRLPALERDCPTVTDDHPLSEELSNQNARGASPYFLHQRRRNELPCMDSGDCPYVERRDAAIDADVLVGHPTHVLSEELVEGRVVIFDEDPGDAYRTQFNTAQRTQAANQFLQGYDQLDVSRVDQVKALASLDEIGGVGANDVLETLGSIGESARQTEALEEDGHAEAPSITLAALELQRQALQEMAGDFDDPYAEDLRQNLGLGYVELPDGTTVVEDLESEALYIRRPPDLSGAAAIVGLDGTPRPAVWKGRLGVDNLVHRQLLCDECRGTYLTEHVGYEFIQTTEGANPYSSGQHVNDAQCYALLEAASKYHDQQVPVITTKKAQTRLFESSLDGPHLSDPSISSFVTNVRHYGDLRSSNEFEGESVGIVLGSPHPGDAPIKVAAAFEGYLAQRGDGRGMDLDYGIADRPFLQHFREDKVAQAVFRFGRSSPATVYVHTAALPDWLAAVTRRPKEGTIVRTRNDGERSIIRTLREEGGGEAKEIHAREVVEIGERQVRKLLKRLYKEGLIERSDSQPYQWTPTDADAASLVAELSFPTED